MYIYNPYDKTYHIYLIHNLSINRRKQLNRTTSITRDAEFLRFFRFNWTLQNLRPWRCIVIFTGKQLLVGVARYAIVFIITWRFHSWLDFHPSYAPFLEVFVFFVARRWSRIYQGNVSLWVKREPAWLIWCRLILRFKNLGLK